MFPVSIKWKDHAMKRRVYGLTTLDIRHVAYEIVEKQNINHCFSKSTEMAGVDLLRGFLN